MLNILDRKFPIVILDFHCPMGYLVIGKAFHVIIYTSYVHLVKTTLPRSNHVHLFISCYYEAHIDRFCHPKCHINRKYILSPCCSSKQLIELSSWIRNDCFISVINHKIFPFEPQEIGVGLYQIYYSKTWATILEIQYPDHGKWH